MTIELVTLQFLTKYRHVEGEQPNNILTSWKLLKLIRDFF